MPPASIAPHLYIGLMSGTSMDGVDGALVSVEPKNGAANIATLAAVHRPFSADLRNELLDLQASGPNEIERECAAANALALLYADCVQEILDQEGLQPSEIAAIGAHGQTIRHQPARGFTRQINNPALLAELSGINVIAEFRTRDIAAGGQGAPLVPAFHQAVFSSATESRAVVNIGGIANVSVLPASDSDHSTAVPVLGFDTGPGNLLMDMWIGMHKGLPYDDEGAWAAGGQVVPPLLERFLQEPFLDLPPPKSTGRDLFHLDWLNRHLTSLPPASAQDVQATLAAFTAITIADAIARHAKGTSAVFVCGGGAYNIHLCRLLAVTLEERKHSARVETTDTLGIRPSQVEPAAFAWLAARFDARMPGNMPSVTGAKGPRILGALYPA